MDGITMVMIWHLVVEIFPIMYIWVNYNDLTVLPSPGIMVNKRNHPKIALFQVSEWL